MNRVEQLSKKTFFFYLGSPKVHVSGLLCIFIMWMSRNPEMIAQSVLERLERQCRVKVTKGYVCALRRRLNWSSKPMKYGQLISVRNVKHRLDWCVQQLSWFGWPLQECNICWRILCWDVFLWSSIFPPAWTESRPLTREGSKIKNIPTKSVYGEGYPTEGKRICAFQWNHGLWNLSRNLRGQLVTICGCTVPWWFSALSGNGNKILWSSYKLWLYVYILRFYIQAH